MTEQQIEYINNRSEIAGHLEAIVSEIYLREESGKIESWFVTIPDLNSYLNGATSAFEQSDSSAATHIKNNTIVQF